MEAGDNGYEFAPAPAHCRGQRNAVKKTVIVVLGVLKSACVSSQMIAGGGAPSPASVPTQLMQPPASTKGKAPRSTTLPDFLRDLTRDCKRSADLKPEPVRHFYLAYWKVLPSLKMTQNCPGPRPMRWFCSQSRTAPG